MTTEEKVRTRKIYGPHYTKRDIPAFIRNRDRKEKIAKLREEEALEDLKRREFFKSIKSR